MAASTSSTGAAQIGPDHATLLARLRHLEREVVSLRRRLEPAAEALPAEPFSALEIRVESRWYAIHLDHLREVVSMVAVTPLPEAPDWVLGVFRFGDDIVPLVDLRRRLTGVATTPHQDHRIVLVGSDAHDDETQGRVIGLAVDEVRHLVEIDPADVVPPRQGIPQAPFLLGTATLAGHDLWLLSTVRLGRQALLDDQGEPTEAPEELDP